MDLESLATGALDPASSEGRLISTLKTVDFPATPDDLLRAAVLDHLEVATIGALHDLPTRNYHGVAEILRALGARRSVSADQMEHADA